MVPDEFFGGIEKRPADEAFGRGDDRRWFVRSVT